MDLQCFHSRSRLKIRRAPSSKISATCSSSQASSSFHGSCCRQIKKRGCNSINVRQPLIFHTFEPETIITEPAEFMSVVQRLTGSPHTRRLQRTSIRKSKEMQLLVRIPGVQLMEQNMQLMQKDPLKEGSTIILEPITPFSNIDLPPSPSCPNPNGSIDQAPDLLPLSHANPPLLSHADPPLLSHTNPPLSPASSDLCSDTNQLESRPSSASLSSNSAVSDQGAIMNMSKESSQSLLPLSPRNPNPNPNPRAPFSSSFLHDIKKLQPSLPSTLMKPNNCKPLIIDNNQICSSPPNFYNTASPEKASDELGNSRGGPLPVSPNSSLTTTSSEDNLSTEGGASPYREAFSYLVHEEVEPSHFFVFSGDSYYGSFNEDHELDFQDTMPLETHSSFFKGNILLED